MGKGYFADNVKEFVVETFEPFINLVIKVRESLMASPDRQHYLKA